MKTQQILGIAAFSAMLLTACKGSQNKSEELDSLATAQVADTTTSAVVPQDTMATPLPMNLDVKKYESRTYYRGETLEGFLVEIGMTLDWPVKAEGYDIKPLQEALWSLHFAGKPGNVQKALDTWSGSTLPDGGFVDCDLTSIPHYDPKKEILEQEPLRDPNGDYPDEIQYAAERTLDITLHSVNQKANLITYQEEFIDNAGCGMGSCIMFGFSYYHYDYVRQCLVGLKDIVAKPAIVAKKLYKKYHADYDGLGDDAYLPDAFIITADNKLTFVYGKYEIGPGADGCPELTINPATCPDAFTSYGKQILGL